MRSAASDEYRRTFDVRGASYNAATRRAPEARARERAIVIELLAVAPEHVVCDVPAGGGYLAEGLRAHLRHPAQVVCLEPSPAFAAALDGAFTVHVAPVDAWPLPAASVDRVGSLAGVHHLDDAAAMLGEARRALRPGGRIAVGDVRADTAPARFLDGAVHRYSVTGHRGRWLGDGELAALLERAGFVDVVEEHRRCDWMFASEAQLVAFCRELFGMVRATPAEVATAIDAAFDVGCNDGRVVLPWSLTFAAGRR